MGTKAPRCTSRRTACTPAQSTGRTPSASSRRFVPGSEIYDLQNRKAHMAFGQGPRMCVAADFALTEAKLALITLYRRFRFDHNPEHEMKTAIAVTLGPTNGIEVLVRRRA